MFTAAVQSLDGAKPNTNPKTNPNPNTDLTVPFKSWQIFNK